MEPKKPTMMLIRLDHQQAEYLRARAAREGGRSVSSLVRDLVMRAVEAESLKPSAA